MTEASLTLPKATTKRRARRRWKREPDWIFLLLAVLDGLLAVTNLLLGRVLPAVLWTVTCSLQWRVFQIQRSGPWPPLLGCASAAFAVTAALIGALS